MINGNPRPDAFCRTTKAEPDTKSPNPTKKAGKKAAKIALKQESLTLFKGVVSSLRD